MVVDWSLVDKRDYLLAMERSPVKDIEIKALLKEALTDKVDDRQVYMKGIDASYEYEGYGLYTMDELARDEGCDLDAESREARDACGSLTQGRDATGLSKDNGAR